MHTQRHQHRLESLSVRPGRWCRTWYPHRQSYDSRSQYSGVRKRSSRNRCGKPYGGHGDDDPLARYLAKGHPILRWCTVRDPVSDSARQHFPVSFNVRLQSTTFARYLWKEWMHELSWGKRARRNKLISTGYLIHCIVIIVGFSIWKIWLKLLICSIENDNYRFLLAPLCTFDGRTTEIPWKTENREYLFIKQP